MSAKCTIPSGSGLSTGKEGGFLLFFFFLILITKGAHLPAIYFKIRESIGTLPLFKHRVPDHHIVIFLRSDKTSSVPWLHNSEPLMLFPLCWSVSKGSAADVWGELALSPWRATRGRLVTDLVGAV